MPKFRRGSMTFEDYNYKQFNKFILVDSHGNTLQSKSSQSSGVESSSSTKRKLSNKQESSWNIIPGKID